MKMRLFRIRRAPRREAGMALLFALGFLALMLILGLGFVTTSLLSQKIAANNSARAQARMFARSAAARAMLNIMIYSDQALLGIENVNNYDSLRSYGKANAGDGEKEVTDQLRGNSKLACEYGNVKYTGESSQASWIFFYDAPSGTEGRRIIGRAAYQVLPRRGGGALSLYAVTGGDVTENDYGAVARKFRWGRDIAELDLDATETFNFSGVKWSQKVQEAGVIPARYDTLYTAYANFFPTGSEAKKKWVEYWFAEGRNPILREAFCAPNPDAGAKRKKVYYHRFNISDFYYDPADRNNTAKDNWYDRFAKIDSNWNAGSKNSGAALDVLTSPAVEYLESDTDDTKIGAISGLPFLRRIGSDPHSFADLERLRRQIAANFNDYCDADSIPTSDVDAKNWNVAAALDSCPKYTGNERTLYINEVAATIGPVVLRIDPATGGVAVESVDAKLVAELVNMYDPAFGDSGAQALLKPENFSMDLGIKHLSFKIDLYAFYNGKVVFERTDSPAVTQEKDFTVEINGSGGTPTFTDTACSVSVNYDSDDKQIITQFSGSKDKDGGEIKGYGFGSTAAFKLVRSKDDIADSAAVAQRFSEKVEEAARAVAAPSGFRYKEHRLTTAKGGKYLIGAKLCYRIRVVEGDGADASNVALLPARLYVNKTIRGGDNNVTLVDKSTGVDFVRFDPAVRIALKSTSGATDDVGVLNAQRNGKCNFDALYLLGGFEARDPRQNLNPYGASAADKVKADWDIDPRIVSAKRKVEDDALAPSLAVKPDSSSGVDTHSVCGGSKNRSANPAAPKYIDNSGSGQPLADGTCDKETAVDPAWLGDNAGEHVSTAYIRNAPMVSPWEIGLIHRGRVWQTLNLTRAGGFGTDGIKFAELGSKYDDWTAAGTGYENGDGGILEFVKVGVNCRGMGKIPLDVLRGDAVKLDGSDTNKVEYSKDVVKMLFSGIRAGQTMKQFYTETKFGAPVASGGNAVRVAESGDEPRIGEDKTGNFFADTAAVEFRSQFLNTRYGFKNGEVTFGMAYDDNDAGREELIGKTVNLLTANGETPPNVFRVIVVAQSIKDVGGIGNDVQITKLHNGATKTLGCQLGRFDFEAAADWDDNTYFDEITGEVKALVTVERVPATDDMGEQNKDYGRMVVTGFEIID